MNLPTKITVTRIVMLPILIALFCCEMYCYRNGMTEQGNILCFVTSLLYIATALTDFLDGYLARKYNQVTTLGKFLDPIADKVCVLTGLAFIMEGNFVYGMPYVAMICTIVIIARELIIGLLRQIAASKKFILAADIWGKAKTVLTLAAIGTTLFVPIGGSFGESTMWAGGIMLIAATVLTVFSALNYIIKNKALFSDKDNKVKEQKDGE